MDDRLAATLAAVAGAMDGAVDRWWVIGSAAMALHGLDVAPADVDVLVSARDGVRLAESFDAAPGPASSGRFRSAPFLRWIGPPIAVEFMGDLEVRDMAGMWVRVAPGAPVFVRRGGIAIPVASLADLADMCRLFGRAKDRRRLALIEGECGHGQG